MDLLGYALYDVAHILLQFPLFLRLRRFALPGLGERGPMCFALVENSSAFYARYQHKD